MRTVTIRPDDVSVCVREGETILDAFMRAGLSYRYACRRGGCTECKVKLLSGEIVYNKRIAEMILPDDERQRGVCLSCRAVPLTDVEFRLQDDDTLKVVSPLQYAVARAEVDRNQFGTATAPSVGSGEKYSE